MLALVDSGSSRTFVSSAFLATVDIPPKASPPVLVKVANGDSLISNTYVPGLEWWVQGHTMQTDMKVLDLGVYDVILGYDWLKSHSPMVCEWDKKILRIPVNGTQMTLKGVQTSQQSLQVLTAEQVVKWYKGNEIRVMALVQEVQEVPSLQLPIETPPEVQTLLTEF